MKNFGAIILAAGKGKRMNSDGTNKVVLPLGEKPMILHAVAFVKSLDLSPIVAVVGFAKESVQNILKEEQIIFAIQQEQLGTADALSKGVEVLPENIEHVLVIQGDDAFFYREENRVLVQKLIHKHIEMNSSVTFLTIELEDPFGIGRIIRDENGNVIKIIEEKDASEVQRQIKEVNSGCYVFETKFLKKYLPQVRKSSVTGEYYLVSLVDLAAKNNETIVAVEGGKIAWRGVNTPAELEEARKLYSQN